MVLRCQLLITRVLWQPFHNVPLICNNIHIHSTQRNGCIHHNSRGKGNAFPNVEESRNDLQRQSSMLFPFSLYTFFFSIYPFLLSGRECQMCFNWSACMMPIKQAGIMTGQMLALCNLLLKQRASSIVLRVRAQLDQQSSPLVLSQWLAMEFNHLLQTVLCMWI